MKNFIFRSLAAVALTFVIIFSSYVAARATAVIDPTFGVNGSVNIGSVVHNSGAVVVDVTTQPDHKIVVTGYVNQSGTGVDIFVARLLPSGAVDNSFGTGGYTITALTAGDEVISDMELQNDGKIVLVGSVPASFPSVFTDFLVMRYNSNGQLDSSFANNGVLIVNQDQFESFKKVAIQTDGKIVAAGTWNNTQAVMRFNPNGTFDSEFAAGGFFYYTFPPESGTVPGRFGLLDVEILSDSRILVGSVSHLDRPDNNDEWGYYIIKLRPDGSLDPAFGNQGVADFLTPYNSGWQYGPKFDMEPMFDGSVAIVDSAGFRFTRFDGHDKYFPQDGATVAAGPGGGAVVGGGVVGGVLKLYSKNAFIGSSWNGGSVKFAVQFDGRIIIVNEGLTRIRNLTSQGTRQVNYNANSPSFNNNDRADLAIYRPGEKRIYVKQEINEFQRNISAGATKIFPEYTPFSVGSNMYRQTIAYWNNGVSSGSPSFFNFERTNTDSPFFRSFWGLAGDLPYGGDFNGDGLLDIGVFRPSNGIWWGLNEPTVSQQSPSLQWGANGDKPVPADYDNDGITDYAIYRPSNGTWWVRRSSDGGFNVFNFGISTDIPLTGDFDGDGRADFTVYRPSEGAWYQLLTTDGFRYNRFGISTDIPVPGDYDGDGKCDIAVYRSGTWHLLQSRDGYTTVRWGEAGDIPITARYDQ